MSSAMSRILGCAIVLGGVLGARQAHAQDWDEPWFFTLEGGASGPIDSVSRDLFSYGGDASIALYRAFGPIFSLGARVRGGALTEGDGIPELEDPGMLDYGYLGLAMRLRPFGGLMDHNRRSTGLYMDLGPGAALLDGEVVPAYEAALGYNFGLGSIPIAIGPRVRYSHYIEVHDRFGTAEDSQVDNDVMGVMTWTAGLEISFLDEAFPEPVVVRPVARVRVPEPIVVDQDRDNDGLVDARDRCVEQPEVWNGFEDSDGCPDQGVGQFVNDALVVDERVFFDFGSDELRPAGREQLDVVARHYQEYGNRYDHLVISGHTDSRGSEESNEVLSERRATAVREYLTGRGVRPEVLRIEAMGATSPSIPNAHTEYEHQVNRRVEFRVEWQVGMRPEGVAPEPNPTMPDYVDPAPPAVQEREARMARREEHRRQREEARAERRGEAPSEPIASGEPPSEPPAGGGPR